MPLVMSDLFVVATIMKIHRPAAAFDVQDYLSRTSRNHALVGGPEGQLALGNLRIAVAGLGGMGGQIAEALIRLGVRHLRLADPDVYEGTNLNRQSMATRATLGRGKVEATMDRLASIAPDVELIGYTQGVAADSVEEFVAGCDIVVDEIDVTPLDRHVMLHRAARRNRLPVYSAFVAGLGVHLYVFEGETYTFERFIDCPEDQWTRPAMDLLAARFLTPLPPYFTPLVLSDLMATATTTGIPIGTPTVLLGHGLLVSRLLLDVITAAGSPASALATELARFPTPRMPRFVALDPVTLQFEVCHAKRD